MITMGYNRKEIEESLKLQKYDDIHATYLLLGRHTTDVSNSVSVNFFLTNVLHQEPYFFV